MAIVTRSGKGSALTYAELDNNFTELANATNNLNQIVTNSTTNGVASAGVGIQLNVADTNTQTDASIVLDKFVSGTATPSPVLTNIDLSVNTVAASGSGGLSYSSANKQFTFTPPDLTSFLTSSSSISSAQLPAIAITSVQTAANEAAMLALTTQEGDVVVRTDETKSYVRNNGTADPNAMSNFTLLQTPDSDTTYGMTISQTGSGTDAVLNDNPILKLDPSNGTDIDITLTGGANTTVTRISDTEVSIASTDTWQANAVGVDGYVAGPANDSTGQNKVWKTDGSGVPAWRDDLDTTLSTGSSTAIQKGDGSGGLTDASAGTDYSTLALGTTNTTALAGDTVVDNLLLEIPKSGGSVNIGDKSWLKVATVTIDARYQYYSAQLAVVGTGAAEGVANEKILAIRVKQQAAMGAAPLVDIDIYNNGNEDYDFGHVVAVNSGTETRVDIYFRPDGPNSGAEVYKMADTATATVAWSSTGNSYATSAPANFVQGGAHQQWHSGNQAGIFGTTNGILKANGSGVLSAATASTDFIAATSGSAIQKADGSGGLTGATEGTDFNSPNKVGARFRLPSGNNSVSGTLKLIEIATINITGQGEHYRASFVTNTTDYTSDDNITETTYLSIRQYAPIGNDPVVYLSTDTSRKTGDIAVTYKLRYTNVTSPSNFTQVKLYASLSSSGDVGAEGFVTSETVSDSSKVSATWESSFAVTDYVSFQDYGNLGGTGVSGDTNYIHTTRSQRWDDLFGSTAGITVTDGNASSPISVIGNGTGFLKNNGSGTYSYDNTTYLSSETDPVVGAITGIVKADGSGTISAATGGTSGTIDYSTVKIGTGATDAMAGNTALSAIGGSLDLSSQVTGTLPVGNMAATALTTVQTAANQAAQLALTTQEGDVVVRTDENKTYMRNSGTADPHDMTNFTLLATPTDAVTSVDGNTGAVTTLQLGTTATTALAGNTTFVSAETDPVVGAITGIVKADGSGNISAAVGGTSGTIDYSTVKIGTGATDALAGNTTYVASETDPVVGAITGIVKADGSGNISAAVAGTDYSTLAIGTTATTALAGNTTFDRITEGDTSIVINDTGTPPTADNNIVVTVAGGQKAKFDYNGTEIAGNNASDTLTLGSTTGTGAITIGRSTKSQTISIGNGATENGETHVISIGTTAGAGTKKINLGEITGAFVVNPDTAGTTTVIGATTQTGTITLGRSTATQIVNINSGATASGSTATVNIGTNNSAGTKTINIGTGGGSGAISNIEIGTNATESGLTRNINIGGASTTAASTINMYGTINLLPANLSGSITIGSATQTGAINFGVSTQSQIINIGAGTTANARSKTINIGTGGASGSIKAIEIGSGNHSGVTTTVTIGNPSATASSTVYVKGDVSIDRPIYGDGATEYYDFFDHLGGMTSSGSDGDWDISGVGLNALTEITIPARASFGNGAKRGSLRMTCLSTIYNSSSTTKRNAQYYLGLQMKSKGTSNQSQNLGAATFVSSPSQFNGLWSFAGNVTDKIVAGFGGLAMNNSATGMVYGAAPILGAIYDDSVNKTYIRISSYYYYNNIGGSALTAGQTTSFDVYYNPTEFKSTGTWVSSLRADSFSSRTNMTIQPQSTHQMHHAFNISIPKDTSKTELRLIFDYSASNTNLTASVQAIEGTIMLEGSRV